MHLPKIFIFTSIWGTIFCGFPNYTLSRGHTHSKCHLGHFGTCTWPRKKAHASDVDEHDESEHEERVRGRPEAHDKCANAKGQQQHLQIQRQQEGWQQQKQQGVQANKFGLV